MECEQLGVLMPSSSDDGPLPNGPEVARGLFPDT